MAESIVLVPAAHMGAVPTLPGSSTSAVAGSRGVRAALAELERDDPVLVLHDDVAVSRRGVARMLDALESAEFVVPHSNEHAVGTYIGALPPVAELGDDLDARAGSTTAHLVLEARYACMMATAGSFAEMGGSLVMPGSNLVRSRARIVAAPCVAAHDLSCNDRLLPDVTDERPLLVASMIVRDEEATLGPALESLRPLVDRIEVCDTGSTDSTIELAKSHGAVVSSIPWRDDFSWARNQALANCVDARFVVLIDADERVHVDDPATFRRWLRTWAHEIDGILVMVDSERGTGEIGTANISTRIARPGSTFNGSIHEALTVASETDDDEARIVIYRGLRVHHTGYLPHVIEKKNKSERNVRIARAALAESGSIKSKIDLARSLRMTDHDDPEAEALFREVLGDLADAKAGTGASFVLAVVAAYEMTYGRLDEAVELAEAALEMTPGEDVALVTLGQILLARGEYDRLAALYDRLQATSPGNPMFTIRRNVLRYRACAARALIHLGRLDEAAGVIAACLEEDPLSTGEWIGPGVPGLVAGGIDPDRLLALLVADSSNHVLDALSHTLRPLDSGRMCLAALQAGCDRPEVYTTLFTVAALTGDTALMAGAAAHGRLVDPRAVEALVDLADRRRPELRAAILGSVEASA
jgi:tetratricopeptide (TPR) repeat protein